LPKLKEPVRYSSTLNAKLADLVESVKASALEGLVAKRADSRYEPGIRSGAWQKMRINQGQEFVIGGYTVGGTTFDALIFGYYEEKTLMYAARTRNGFTPALRAELMKKTSFASHKRMPLCQSSREEEMSMGPRTHGRKDEGMSLGKTGPRRAIRIS
jgi:bifunctional non-homologous end joining protein LigD